MAEMVSTGGSVITVAGERPEEEALTMRDGRTVAVAAGRRNLATRHILRAGRMLNT